jgi:hypothetical protein
MRGVAGILLAGIGVLHLLLGTFLATHLWEAIAAGHVVNPVESHRPGVTLEFWFLMFGFPLLFLGHLCAWVERRLHHRVPAFVGWELLALSLLGIVLDPDSGFWLVLGVAVYMLVRSRRAPSAPGGSRDRVST